MLVTSSSESDLSEPEHLIEEFEVSATIGKLQHLKHNYELKFFLLHLLGENSNDENDMDMDVVSGRDSERNGSQLFEFSTTQRNNTMAEKDTILPELDLPMH